MHIYMNETIWIHVSPHQALLRRKPPLGRGTGEEYSIQVRDLGAPRPLQEVNVNLSPSRKKTVCGCSSSPLYSVSFQNNMRFRIRVKHILLVESFIDLVQVRNSWRSTDHNQYGGQTQYSSAHTAHTYPLASLFVFNPSN